MLRRTRQLWRWIRVVAVVGIVWLILSVARDSDPFPAASTSWSRSRHDPTDDICRPHGWKPSRPKDPSKPRKVYDLMMINTELDHLEFRLNTTFAEVDYFVLVESRKAFTYLDKPLTLKKNLAKFHPYASKIIYHEIEFPPDFSPRTTWDIEDLHRNAMLTQVFPRLRGAQAPQLGDVLVVSDWLHRGPEWPHPQATYYQGMGKTLRPNDLRIGDGGVWPFWNWETGAVRNASWHCSNCFETMGELLNKMGSFSHMKLNAVKYRDPGRIADRVRNGKDLWDRKGEVYDRVEDNVDVPRFLLLNKERFGYMIDRDGPEAGFTDYEG
ncbi:glycosyltransferase family 17 protein [Parathielavia appendiculata]|uniref:Glycosyltransferase family 17 protein n=1 Tax=Parathielavia appendiculata TaxID=2587402 RepID=A0AAN6Z8E6_9PEZI|nr:glycosyltransferase family 17 protein [Parathielavia appendiculata]